MQTVQNSSLSAPTLPHMKLGRGMGSGRKNGNFHGYGQWSAENVKTRDGSKIKTDGDRAMCKKKKNHYRSSCRKWKQESLNRVNSRNTYLTRN